MSLDTLPDEVWLRVLCENVVGPRELGRFALCSNRCRRLVDDERVWKTKFAHFYPSSYHGRPMVLRSVGWKAAFKKRTHVRQTVIEGLNHLSHQYINRQSAIVAYYRIGQSMGLVNSAKDSVEFNFTVDELRTILGVDELYTNLTNRFYALQCVAFLVHEHLKDAISVWLRAEAPQEQDLVEGICLIDEWFLPNRRTDRARVDHFIERLRLMVVEFVAETMPTHPYKRRKFTGLETPDQRAVINALAHVFIQEKLVSDSDNDENDDVERLCIGQVINTKFSRPIMLCVLAQLVAHKLGIQLECIRFPGRIMVRFAEHPDLDSTQRYTYFDVWDRFRARAAPQLWEWYSTWSGDFERNAEHLEVATSEQLLRRLCNNALNARHQSLMSLLYPLELSVVFSSEWRLRKHLAQFYVENLQSNRDVALDLLSDVPTPSTSGGCPFMGQVSQYAKQLERDLQRFGIEAPPKDIDIMLRSQNSEVKYACGAIMQHKKYNYKCVIVGWDPVCTAMKQWQDQMGVHRMERGAKQPFYHVLADDGSTRYAAEDNLVYEPNPIWLGHDDIPRYFESFQKTYYVQNSAHGIQYPDDKAALKAYVQIFYKDADLLSLD